MAPAFPPIYLLPTHLSLEARQELVGRIPSLTHDITEAKVILSKIATKQRAQFELRCRKLWTEEVVQGNTTAGAPENDERKGPEPSPTLKRQRVSIEDGLGEPVDSSTESETEAASEPTRAEAHPSQESARSHGSISPLPPVTPPAIVSSPIGASPQIPDKPPTAWNAGIEWGDTVRVVKLLWFDDCLAAGYLVPFGNYLVYEGRLTQRVISAREIIAKVRHVPLNID
jgi:DNA polymerase IV